MKITKQTTKDEIMAMDYLYGHDLNDCHEKLTDDEEVVLKFIEHYFGNFMYASDRLKKDREFIKLAIQKNAPCFLYADEWLRKDKEFIVELIMLSNVEIVRYAYYTIVEEVYEHLKPYAIEYLKNQLEKDNLKSIFEEL